MYVFGAVILTVVGTFLMQGLLNLGAPYLLQAMYSTTGVALLPMIMIVALTGCAYYAGLYFALKTIPSANPRHTLLIIIAVVVLGTIIGLVRAANDGEPIFAFVMQLANGVAAAVGVLLARFHIDTERTTLRQAE